MAPAETAFVWTAIQTIHYAYIASVFLYFFLASTVTVCMLQTLSQRIDDEKVRRDLILWLIFAISSTYVRSSDVFRASTQLTDGCSLENQSPSYARSFSVYLLTSAIIFGAQALVLTDAKFPVWYPYLGTWLIGIAVEMTLVVLQASYESPSSAADYTTVSIQVARVAIFASLVFVYYGLRNDEKEYDNPDAEQQSLLRKRLAPKPSSLAGSSKGYGSTTRTKSSDSDSASSATAEDSWLAKQKKSEEMVQKRLQQDGNWFTYAKGFAIFVPYVWPTHNKALQFRTVLVGFCLLSTNALNVLVPYQMGVMIDSLTKYTGGNHNINVWLSVAVYIGFRFASSSACIGLLQAWLWMPVEQYSYEALSTAAHAHILTLSSNFHDSKNSSDLVQAVQGGRSVSDLLETVCFKLVPMFIDLAVAFVYLWTIFGPYMGLLMAATASAYLYITTKLINARAQKRRNYIAQMRKEWTVGYASLDGWITASMFNMISHEQNRYSSAVREHLSTRFRFQMASQSATAAQGIVMTVGLLGALWLGTYQVAYGDMSVGKFATLLVYWAQLSGPLTFFSTMFKTISYSLMDAERLLELFQAKPTIIDKPNAEDLKLDKASIRFDDVSFSYDERKQILKNISFTVAPGKTVALVGETGGGKSTILKLVDRFYDVKSGCISIDGQDIREVKLSSLREHIGVVPQDPALFNDTIMNNIRYARLSATDEEVYDACKAAAVHDKIMTFPDDYSSKVGSNGVKLSGGEKQRIAIARAILKQPDIILLDEATSAVDTDTECLIQAGLNTLCQSRTTFIVAHRLSTIMRADCIFVVMNGEIVEKGTHQDLIHSKGKYYDLWSKQLFVTPSDKRSRSRSPKKNADTIDDVNSPKKMVELTKVIKTAKHDCPPAEETKKDDGKKTGSSHQREVSSSIS
ncbi:hypothetical protein BJ875DRAFT_505324 [Amylocarpus encephaloides]|uniref:Heavy metal tolerance protein n=1 Tax=Amylocarpus encephaloides TaxID=45428 RepID=A0A9P7YH54_9HELO|nr:hypothetical protein BJ875DRAFT_505324 [Amylocarpus encephaloides]